MNRRALVVDDDRAMVKTLADILQLEGWRVATAQSGIDAVAIAGRETFDVVVMDIRMPGMDGVDAYKAIKATQPSARVVLMTAYAAQDRIEEATREGVLRILAKPVDLSALIELMTTAGADARRVRKPFGIDHVTGVLDAISRR